MSTALPAASAFTGASVTEGAFKTALTDLRTFLAERIGQSAGTDVGVFTSISAGTATFKIVGGSTSVSLRNNVDSADNLLITDAGILSTRGTGSTSGAAAGELVVPNAKHLRGANAAASGALAMIGINASDYVVIGGQTDTTDTGNLPRIAWWAAAALPAGAAGRNGIVAVEGTNNRLVYYSGGARYYLAGTTF